MKTARHFEFPPDRRRDHAKAMKLEWATIGFLISVIVLMYLVMGNSQAMKAAWLEDMFSLIPSISFLIASRVARRRPNESFPYGYHRAATAGYMTASLALFAMGGFLLIDSAMALIKVEHPTIGTTTVMGREIWLGWLMIAVLIYSAVPAAILGRAKLPLASRLNDKVIYADARMNAADWKTALAAIVGIIGIGLGFWWADAVVALFISFDILNDGSKHLRNAATALIARSPRTLDGEDSDLPARIRERLMSLDWVTDAFVRLREEGHLIYGEAYAVPVRDTVTVEQLSQAKSLLEDIDWRLGDITVAALFEHSLKKNRPEPG